ncbi:MAG: hypothetical protein CNIPEHKO_03375 [Anaerolineales bacterium]|nr:hypothetical protein [Anaerolineales bacterium]
MNAEEKEKKLRVFSVYPRPIKKEAIIKWDADEQDERGRKRKKLRVFSVYPRPIKKEAIIKWDAGEQDERGRKRKNSASSALIRVQLKRKQLSNGTRTSKMNAEEKEKTPRIQRLSASN